MIHKTYLHRWLRWSWLAPYVTTPPKGPFLVNTFVAVRLVLP